jgi:tetratricopeptide (TPR) repeat protein
MVTPRVVKVFIASPGDLAVERRAFKEVIDALNTGFGRGADLSFEPLGWEDALSQVGRRSQSVINKDVDACDVFVLVMWRRWGQEAPDASPYTSYTEEEFYRALSRFEKAGCPTIVVLFKHIDPGQMADPGDQLKKVLAFRKKLEETRSVLYRGFADETHFKREIDSHLVAYAKGELTNSGDACAVPIVPDSIKAELEKYRAEAQRAIDELERQRAASKQMQAEAELARAQAKDAIERSQAAENAMRAKAAAEALMLAENAAKAALDGNLEEARQGFAKALDGTTNLKILFLGYSFFKRIGELEEAERLVRRWLAVSGPETKTASTAAAYTNLGVILQTRGDWENAKAMHHKALEVNTALDRSEGIANSYNNLGVILSEQDDLAEAEAMCRRALALYQELDTPAEVASVYGNLGNILHKQGDLDGAEAMHRQSLAIETKLGRLEGMASDYGNLGIVLHDRGDLDGAEAMHKQSLAIETKLGHLEGMAQDYFNLAMIRRSRRDWDGARDLMIKSRDLYSKLSATGFLNRVQAAIDRLPAKPT